MDGGVQFGLRFNVPAPHRKRLLDELERKPQGLDRTTLSAMYLDTTDRLLARSGLEWRLRREGRRWVQSLKAVGVVAYERLEHEVIRSGPLYEVEAHAGTPLGERLRALLRDAGRDHGEVGVRFQTELRRSAVRTRARGAVADIVYDEGRLLSDELTLPVHEVEFLLVSGSPLALVALAARWVKRHGLVLEPRSKADRGDRLAEGERHPPIRKAARPVYGRGATAVDALAAVMDECLAHIIRNAIGLSDGDPGSRVEHVHQLRVGIRRLRSALRCFEGWIEMPPPALVDGLRRLFATLGVTRDNDVLSSGVVTSLTHIGAPLPRTRDAGEETDLAQLLESGPQQQLLLDWVACRMALAQTSAHRAALETASPAAEDGAQAGDTATEAPEPSPAQDATAFHRAARKRLRRWHRRIAADSKVFDELDETHLHALRKRIKRQRYAVEFFAPVLERRDVSRYLDRLTVIQDRMGELNDLVVARARYEASVSEEPKAWFALGWIASRIETLRALAKPELEQLAGASPPK